VRQFGFGDISMLRPANILGKLPAYRKENVSDFEFKELYGFGPGHYAWKVISTYRSLDFVNDEGERVTDATNNIRFDVVTKLILILLSTERPQEGFTSEFLYMRLWKALQHILEGQNPVQYAALDFVHHMEVLRVIEILGYEYDVWQLTLLGRRLLERWPTDFVYHSDEEALAILSISETLEVPTLEEAEEALSNYF
jgi:hypothetical protein